jgi:hypothetical protein
MTTLNQLIFRLWEMRRSFIKETDPIDKRLIIDWVQTTRARLLEQKFKQSFSSIDDGYVQALGPIGLEKVVSNELDPVIDDFTYLYRTNIVIPLTIASPEGAGTFTRIGSADRTGDHFQVTTYKKALAYGSGKFNRDEVYAFPLGDRVYVTSKSGKHLTLRFLDIRGVFQDPIQAAKIKDPNWTYDDIYPVNKELVDQLEQLVISTKFGLTLQQQQDKTDDRADNPEGGVQKNVAANIQKRPEEE